ncbi:hypothetical protein CVT26_007479 [Gymnopilus dilepis]|uniref:DUF6534 domain-containing protein n=1 Tax=Gymnopilus dilepis TaxID=231916 RepID=A0A409WSI4_9AGAR|nr:hypothetical protein CVT26_007479 [Gymnopilus dilepis]
MEMTLDNTIGASYLGSAAASILYGITLVQTYMYYLTYPNDWTFQRISRMKVGILILLDTLHLAVTIHAVYHYVISSFGNVLALELIVWTFKLQTALNVVVVLFVQSLYALRVWKLGRHFHRLWPALVILAVASGYVIGILLAVKVYHIDAFIELSTVSWVIYASFASATAIDIILAIAMCYYLGKSRSSFSGTTYRIVKVMQYVLVSGFLTSACSLSALITFATMPTTLIFLGIEFLLTKLYINSYLAMLNARKSVRDDESSAFSMSRLMNIRGGGTQLSSNNMGMLDDKDIPLSPLSPVSPSYQSKFEENFTVDPRVKRSKSARLSGVHVYRTQELHYSGPGYAV